MGNYEYRCRRCDSREITFREIVFDDKIVFYCYFCDKDFITEDREGDFLPHKINSLRKRYPKKKKIKKGGKKRDNLVVSEDSPAYAGQDIW